MNLCVITGNVFQEIGNAMDISIVKLLKMRKIVSVSKNND